MSGLPHWGQKNVRLAGESTIVTAEMPLRPMIGEGHLAVVAHVYVAALRTFHEWGESPTVLQEDNSFVAREAIGDLLPEKH